MKELNKKTQDEFLLASKSKDMIREMMEQDKAKKGKGKGKEKMKEDPDLLEMERHLNILTRKTTIPNPLKEAPTPPVDSLLAHPLPQAAPIPPAHPTPPPQDPLLTPTPPNSLPLPPSPPTSPPHPTSPQEALQTVPLPLLANEATQLVPPLHADKEEVQILDVKQADRRRVRLSDPELVDPSEFSLKIHESTEVHNRENVKLEIRLGYHLHADDREIGYFEEKMLEIFLNNIENKQTTLQRPTPMEQGLSSTCRRQRDWIL